MRLINCLIIILLISCSANKKAVVESVPPSDSIFFVTLKIFKDSISSANKIELISKKESAGKMKPATNKTLLTAQNYLTVYIYINKNLTDSFSFDHPLYKHFEYLDADKTFLVKDTIVAKEDFFFRIQKHGASVNVKIVETLKNKSKTELVTLKL